MTEPAPGQQPDEYEVRLLHIDDPASPQSQDLARQIIEVNLAERAHKESLGAEMTGQPSNPDNPEDRNRWLGRLAHSAPLDQQPEGVAQPHAMLGIFNNQGVLAGYIVARKRNGPCTPDAHTDVYWHNLFVCPEMDGQPIRGQGLGRMLMQAALRQSHAEDTITLDTGALDARAAQMYEHYGFERDNKPHEPTPLVHNAEAGSGWHLNAAVFGARIGQEVYHGGLRGVQERLESQLRAMAHAEQLAREEIDLTVAVVRSLYDVVAAAARMDPVQQDNWGKHNVAYALLMDARRVFSEAYPIVAGRPALEEIAVRLAALEAAWERQSQAVASTSAHMARFAEHLEKLIEEQLKPLRRATLALPDGYKGPKAQNEQVRRQLGEQIDLT